MHTSQSEYNLFASLRKYLLDSGSGINFFFEYQPSTPKDENGIEYTSWVVVSLVNRKLGTVAEQVVMFDLFIRQDIEHSNMYSLSDSVVNIFTDSDGDMNIVPFYAEFTGDPSTWVSVGGLTPTKITSSEIYPAKDDTSIKSIAIVFKWGSM